MLKSVQRIIVKAKPSKHNIKFHEWETATIIFFVDETDKKLALELVNSKLNEIKWEILYYELKDTLIEESILEAEDIIKDAYVTAKSNKIFYKIIHDTFGFGKRRNNFFYPPKINEKFIEEVVVNAGGRRLSLYETSYSEESNADFIVGNFIFELKILTEEGLDKKERREKISNIFSKYIHNDEPIYIDPSILTYEDQKIYFSIISSPIEKRIKKAYKQVKATRNRISPKSKIGLIYLNSGYLSMSHEFFKSEVHRYIDKNKITFDEVICLSMSAQTNGFEIFVEFYSDPHKHYHKATKAIINSWNTSVEDVMSKLAKGQIDNFSEPQKPISFTDGGREFYWLPYRIERFDLKRRKGI